MALNSYAALKEAVASWLFNRTDLAAVIPDFIALSEAQMNKRLRVRAMIARAEAAIAAEFVATPGDFIAPVDLILQTDPIAPLEPVSPQRLNALKAEGGASGKPRLYAVVGGELQFWAAPDQSYTAELTYYARIPALSDAAPSNWVLAQHPDVYLYGALVQAAPYLMDDARTALWGELFVTALADIEKADRLPGGKLRTELATLIGQD